MILRIVLYITIMSMSLIVAGSTESKMVDRSPPIVRKLFRFGSDANAATKSYIRASESNTFAPSESPSEVPSIEPSRHPTVAPSEVPSEVPSFIPTSAPTTLAPSTGPSLRPTEVPSVLPSMAPSGSPSIAPSFVPTIAPTLIPSEAPTKLPTVQPTMVPTLTPTCNPSVEPTLSPTAPTVSPSEAPSVFPSVSPTVEPSETPSLPPTQRPSLLPTLLPTALPSIAPSVLPTVEPTLVPSMPPTVEPSLAPSQYPSIAPSHRPTVEPSLQPTARPSISIPPSETPTLPPSETPTVIPTALPTVDPTIVPTALPSIFPTDAPSETPTIGPTELPSVVPTLTPSASPTQGPSPLPTEIPSIAPTTLPTNAPTLPPTIIPTEIPSILPSATPTILPTEIPTLLPTIAPSIAPTEAPSEVPSAAPSVPPTVAPSEVPTVLPTALPSIAPSTTPSMAPSRFPTIAPTLIPTVDPTIVPTFVPTVTPTVIPTEIPTTQPSVAPTIVPSLLPTIAPTYQPSDLPTIIPSISPTAYPTSFPSGQPSTEPSSRPSGLPSTSPSVYPSSRPTSQPSRRPTKQPSSQPSRRPTGQPTSQPTRRPTGQPTGQPTRTPSGQPTNQPTVRPTAQPTLQPVSYPSSEPSTQPSSSPTAEPSGHPTAYPSSLVKTPFTFVASTVIHGSSSSAMGQSSIDAFEAAIAETLTHLRGKDVTVTSVTTTTASRRLEEVGNLRGGVVSPLATLYNFDIDWQAVTILEECGYASYSDAFAAMTSELTLATADSTLVHSLQAKDSATFSGVTITHAVVNKVPTATPTAAPHAKKSFGQVYIIITAVIGGFFLCLLPLVYYINRQIVREREIVEQHEREQEEANDKLYKRFPHVNPNRVTTGHQQVAMSVLEKNRAKRQQQRDAEATKKPEGSITPSRAGRHVTINTVNTNIREIEHISDLSESGEDPHYQSSDADYEVSRASERSQTPPIPAVLLGQDELQTRVGHLIIVNKMMRSNLNMEIREFSSAIAYFMKTTDELTIAQLSRLQEYMNNLEDDNYKLGERLERINTDPHYEFIVEPMERPPSPLTRTNLNKSPSVSSTGGRVKRQSSTPPPPMDYETSSADESVTPSSNADRGISPQVFNSLQYQQRVFQKAPTAQLSRQQTLPQTPPQYVSPGARRPENRNGAAAAAQYYGGQLTPPIQIVVPEIPKIKTFTDVRAKYYADMMKRSQSLGNSPNSFTDAHGRVVSQRRSLHHNINYDERDPDEVVLAYNTQKNSTPTSPIAFAAHQYQNIERRLPTPPVKPVVSNSKRKDKGSDKEAFLR